MSFEPDNKEHEVEVESNEEQIIQRLDAIVFLLETIANIEHGETKDFIGD